MPAAPLTAWMAQPRAVVERRPGDAHDLTFAWWTRGPSAEGGAVLVSVTDFEVRRIGDLLRVYREGLRLRRAWPSLSGAVGMWMWTKPLRKRAGSVSVWCEEADLARFVRWPPHVRVMRDFRKAGELRSASWLESGFDAREVWTKASALLARRDAELAHRGARR